MYDFDLRPIMWMFWVGVVASLLGVFVGVPALAWFLFAHVSIGLH